MQITGTWLGILLCLSRWIVWVHGVGEDGSIYCALDTYAIVRAGGCYCPEGYYYYQRPPPPEAPWNPASETCFSCAAGFFSVFTGVVNSPTSCTACPGGTYNPSLRQGSCTPCPAGTYNLYTARVALAACLYCPVESYCPNSGMSTYILCPAGTYGGIYGGQVGKTVCPTCADGYASTAIGASSYPCQACIAGTYAPAQPASSCIACTAGTYTNFAAMTACIACPSGKYMESIYVAQTSDVNCAHCPFGGYNVLTGRIDCVPCSLGTYNTGTGQTAAAACVACASGTFNPYPYMSFCSSCSAGRFASTTQQTV